MYLNYFGLAERPFSIAPDPQYLYMSARHREAMAHLSYGLSQGGCFIVLTGEVGTGKTTLCRNLLDDLPDDVDVALILNPNINEQELLETVCDELKITYAENSSQKKLLDVINQYLLQAFSDNRHTVLIIDEAQLLSRDVLEQIRLLTNLETNKSKLLQIILIGQPELTGVLARNDLRQLAQRVTARYHLPAISKAEIQDYVNFRLGVAGCRKPLFSAQSLRQLHRLSGGIPRKINVLADHALLGAYAKSQLMVDSKLVKEAAKDVLIDPNINDKPNNHTRWWGLAALLLVLNLLFWWWFAYNDDKPQDSVAEVVKDVELVPNLPLSETASVNMAAVEQDESSAQLSDEADTNEVSTVPALVNTSAESVSDIEPEQQSADSDGGGDSSNGDAALTTIVKSADIEPGSVVISDDFLDITNDSISDSIDTSPQASPLESPQIVTPPAYLQSTPFANVLASSADKTGRISAFRNLAAAWDAPLPDALLGPLCDELETQEIACLPVSNWAAIKRYNRPTIMVLEHGSAQHRVILFKLEDVTAHVLVGEQDYQLPVSELLDRWNNNAMVFWRPGVVGSEFLQQGQRSQALPRVRLQLNRAFAKLNIPLLGDVESPVFDASLANRVRQFQSDFGILADGKIGSETYLLMSELLSPDEVPVLVPRVERP